MLKVLSGARLFDGERMIEGHALVVDDGRVVSLAAPAQCPPGAERHDLGGGVLAPGLIDWQVNGGGGVLFNDYTGRRLIEVDKDGKVVNELRTGPRTIATVELIHW